VLLDVGLPGLNGHEVAKLLRQQPSLQGTVLIALTGYGQDADRQMSLDAGFNHHLVKPASFKSIKEVLATLPATPARDPIVEASRAGLTNEWHSRRQPHGVHR
jgi:CheY-like chemotaxis protein